jgi:heme exporter protein D
MGGYALYVWGSFGVCAVGMALEVLQVQRRRKRILKTLQRQALADHFDQETL